MMNRMAVALLVALSPLTVSAAENAPPPAWIEQSRQLAMQLGTELKGELSRAMTDSGPTAAIGVCRTRAPEIAARLSQQSGARVGRTALRVRNPANAPDDLQRALLEQFGSELASAKFQGPRSRPRSRSIAVDRSSDATCAPSGTTCSGRCCRRGTTRCTCASGRRTAATRPRP